MASRETSVEDAEEHELVVLSELVAEKEFLELGKAYGKSEEELFTFVNERLDVWRKAELQRMERNSRAQARQDRAKEEERREAKEQRAHELELAKVKNEGRGEENGKRVLSYDDEDSFSRAVRTHRVDVPKFDDKQDVAAYLDLFEAVMRKNGEEEESWPLYLRTAVLGTKLAGSVCIEDFTNYSDVKTELLLAFGTTATAVWRELLSSKQLPRETFRQFMMRVVRLVMRWAKLASKGSVELSAGAIAILGKQIVLESVSPSLAAYLLRCREDTSESGFDEFADAGTTYQASLSSSGSGSSRQHSREPTRSRSEVSTISSTAQVFSVVADELRRLPLSDRRARAMRQKLCFNCLKPGHAAAKCYSKPQCNICSRKHHSLLHDPEASISSFSCQTRNNNNVHLMTAIAEVKGVTRRAKVRVFLDLGSQASFVSSSLVEAVKPRKIGSQSLAVRSFDRAERPLLCNLYEFSITGSDGQMHTITAYEKSSLDLRIDVVSQATIDLWRSRGIELSDQHVAGVPTEPHLMLGADAANSFLQQKCQFDGDFVWRTELGWVLSGPSSTATSHTDAAAQADDQKTVVVNFVHTGIEKLWELEEPAARTSTLPEFPIKKNEQRYEVGLLWKSAQRPEDNFPQAKARASQLLEKLQRQQKRANYDDVLMREYIELGAVELEPEPDSSGYYMPHHAVFRAESTTTKTRVVFNASASYAGNKSLNQLLDPGPSLLPSLTGLLLRFREQPVAVQADIRKAFFMVEVSECDRRYLRFVWPDDTGSMKIWRLTRVPFGVNCSPFLLSAVLRHHINEAIEVANPDNRELLRLLRDSLYVDDCVTSVKSIDAAKTFKGTSVSLLTTAGMDLRKWKSNAVITDGVVQSEGKVLGLEWNAVQDELRVPKPTSDDYPSTKRRLFHCVSSCFDPLGFVSPYVLRGKIHLQQLWKLGIDWDSPVPEKLRSAIGQWWGERDGWNRLSWPRYLNCDTEVFVHLFCDASETAFGCCIYVATSSTSELIFSKSKVAPTKQRSLAQLELQAAYIGTQWLEFVLTEMKLPVVGVFAWTDSMTVMHWIAGQPHRWKTFVANRVARIQDVTDKWDVKWRHCPGSDNPADMSSRGASVAELERDLWRRGPSWLKKTDDWPVSSEPKATAAAAMEVKVNAINVASRELPQWLRLSKWSRVLGVAKRLLKWRPKSRAALDASELEHRATALIFRLLQMELFPEEMHQLRASQDISRSSKLYEYRPFLDDSGVMRVRGRLSQSQLEYDAKHPVLLAKHHITHLLLTHLHQRLLHQGTETVLAAARQLYWIIGDRRMLRSVKSRCVRCRRYDARPADEISPPLPADRVIFQRPFGTCGVDYAGPLMLQDGGKAWIVLFVCSTTRAVHLDLVRSLETSEFLLAYRRFVARWDEPTRVRSDNGTCFRSAAKLLNIDWVFNPPAAPWFGGFFERLVGTVKRPLIKVLGRAYVYEKELRTLLCEVESAVNKRPLTHVGDWQAEEPITPAALCGKIWSAQTPEESSEVLPQQLQKRKRYVTSVSKHLANRWRREYLTSLSAYCAGKSAPPTVGDVVFIMEDGKRRQHWRLGRVAKLFAGRDGQCRVAELQVKAGTNDKSTLQRPIRRLVPLEVADAPVARECAAQQPAATAANQPSFAQPARRPVVVSASGGNRTRTRTIRPPNRY